VNLSENILLFVNFRLSCALYIWTRVTSWAAITRVSFCSSVQAPTITSDGGILCRAPSNPMPVPLAAFCTLCLIPSLICSLHCWWDATSVSFMRAHLLWNLFSVFVTWRTLCWQMAAKISCATHYLSLYRFSSKPSFHRPVDYAVNKENTNLVSTTYLTFIYAFNRFVVGRFAWMSLSYGHFRLEDSFILS